MKRILTLLGFIVLAQAAGSVGGIFTASSLPMWYAYLNKPSWSPSDLAFGPVWVVLYTLMGVAAFLVWDKGWKNPEIKNALWVFGFQLWLNILWSAIFFGAKNPGGALLEIIFLWLAIAWTIKSFAKISKKAAWLLVPYLLWVTFAIFLNYAIWSLN